MYIARAFAQQTPFLTAIAQFANGLPPQVISVSPTLGNDWNGEPAIYFQINEQAAKDYLLAMLPTRERKQPQPPKAGKPPKKPKPRPTLGTP